MSESDSESEYWTRDMVEGVWRAELLMMVVFSGITVLRLGVVLPR